MSVKLRLLSAIVLLVASLTGTVLAGGFNSLSLATADFEPVLRGKSLEFPTDFGAHPKFRLEWWYLTANLKDAAGQSYGVQWTLFRQAIASGEQREGWANQQAWMGHAALTTANEHLVAETTARGGIGQAGVTAAPFRAWIDDWLFASTTVVPDAGLSHVSVTASGARFRYTLTLSTDKPIVQHGDHGFSEKSDDGAASYYYSQPFFKVDGMLTLDGLDVPVTGQAWMDREWSSRLLSLNQTGWDWFSLHLESGEKVMVFRLRGREPSGYFAGTWIDADGTPHPMAGRDITLEPLAAVSVAGRQVPIRWRVRVKSHGLDVDTSAFNAQSWMATSVPYWEGPIQFSGSHRGRGYLEMTGY